MLKSKATATTVYLRILRVTENRGVVFNAEDIRIPKKAKALSLRVRKAV